MRVERWMLVCALLYAQTQTCGDAAELKDCVKLSVAADGQATLSNACSDRLNLIYCVDNAKSPRSCAMASLGVTTLSPGSVDVIPGYADSGAGSVHWAVCVYPEAPVQWKPGPDRPYACRKTCVMC